MELPKSLPISGVSYPVLWPSSDLDDGLIGALRVKRVDLTALPSFLTIVLPWEDVFPWARTWSNQVEVAKINPSSPASNSLRSTLLTLVDAGVIPSFPEMEVYISALRAGLDTADQYRHHLRLNLQREVVFVVTDDKINRYRGEQLDEYRKLMYQYMSYLLAIIEEVDPVFIANAEEIKIIRDRILREKERQRSQYDD